MEYRYLGRSGLQVSALSYGAWVTFSGQIDVDRAAECMSAAYEAGVNFFDNAEVYADGRAESVMGEVLAKMKWKRSDLVISTKIFWGGSGPNDRGLSRKHIIEGLDASLHRLRLDYVDLLYCHRPDLHTPLEETVRAMNFCIQQGKAFYWGTSEWSAAQLERAAAIARRENLIPPLMEQPQYNMLHRARVEVEYAPLYDSLGLGTTVWSPLASGFLSGKYKKGIPTDSRLALADYAWLRENFEGSENQWKYKVVENLEPVAARLDATLAQLALAWCLRNPHVSTVITGATKPGQVQENMKAVDVAGRMDGEVMDEIEEILGNRPAPEKDWR